MTIVLATRNAHKIEEIRAILGSGPRFLTFTDFPEAPEVVEDAGSFAGNATKKAVESSKYLGRSGQVKNGQDPIWVLADVSGLEVDALGGAPGVHSARFAALDSGKSGNSSDAENRTKLLHLMESIPEPKRTARFRCVIALTPVIRETEQGSSPICYSDESELQTELFEGSCEGRILLAPRGQGGFGYDPLFVPVGQIQTFAELPQEMKNRLSHRAQALEKAKRFIWAQA